ncbi:B3 domain-containing protein At3g19184-like isoform X2 [Carica papaya]|uniref:B3 domain-containing protein At3g19184-like isoform X2 n=1 Tax=Carica papaya TaxID=3649 RepID=UPI000B8CEECA|nr:B3 domain-containing protein At3g19184-like isoform X2 [Carica papaya]
MKKQKSRQVRDMNDKYALRLRLASSSSSKKVNLDIRQGKPLEAKMNQTQIPDKPIKPGNDAKQVVCDEPTETRSCKHKRAVVDEAYGLVQAKSPTVEQAEKVQASLSSRFPSFIKTLVRSNVNSVFWMHLPIQFCKLHLPRHDVTVTLENENGKEYKISFIAERTALSAGWKKFSDAHELLEGDVLVFQLISSTKFKVYVVRAKNAKKVDGELPLIDLDTRLIDSVHTETNSKSTKRPKHVKILPLLPPPDNVQNNSLKELADHATATNKSENNHKNLGSKNPVATSSSGPIDGTKNIGSIDSFTILLNGTSIDSDISSHHKTKYYELCCSQNSLLHEDLLKSINHKLAAEIITQTVNIAEAITASKLWTSESDYDLWDKTLKGLSCWG